MRDKLAEGSRSNWIRMEIGIFVPATWPGGAEPSGVQKVFLFLSTRG